MQTAEELKQQGIEFALQGAERAVPNFEQTAYGWFTEYAKSLEKGEIFRTEEARAYAEFHGFSVPNGRAWGAIPPKAVKAGLIEWAGYGKSSGKSCHKTPVSTWRVL